MALTTRQFGGTGPMITVMAGEMQIVVQKDLRLAEATHGIRFGKTSAKSTSGAALLAETLDVVDATPAGLSRV
jgi:hypothetical protein